MIEIRLKIGPDFSFGFKKSKWENQHSKGHYVLFWVLFLQIKVSIFREFDHL
jgi:hypothetical protein